MTTLDTAWIVSERPTRVRDDLGPEALYILDVAAFPAVVIIDFHGRHFHEAARRERRRVRAWLSR